MKKYIEKFSLTGVSFVSPWLGQSRDYRRFLHNGEIFATRVIEMKKLFENSLNKYLPDPDPNLAQTDAVGCGIYTN